MALTPKQERFVQEYLVDCNATQAAVRAGYSPRTAYSAGGRLLKTPAVRSALQEAQAQLCRRTGITQDRVLQETARLAFFDARRLFDSQGRPLKVSQLDDDCAAALIGLELRSGPGPGGGVRRYRLADKLKALELLGRRVGAFEPQAQDSGLLPQLIRALRQEPEDGQEEEMDKEPNDGPEDGPGDEPPPPDEEA